MDVGLISGSVELVLFHIVTGEKCHSLHQHAKLFSKATEIVGMIPKSVSPVNIVKKKLVSLSLELLKHLKTIVASTKLKIFKGSDGAAQKCIRIGPDNLRYHHDCSPRP